MEMSLEAGEVLAENNIVYLSMEVRTGKTLTAFNTILNDGGTRCAVLTKKKAMASIEADAAAIGIDADVINYESIHKLPEENYDYWIIDEAHSLGAFPKPSNRFKNVKARIRPADKVILMSGTPTPESYSQIYHQFSVHPLNPFSPWRNFYAWAREFVKVKQKRVAHGQFVKDYGDATWDEIEKHIGHLMLNITQAEAGFEQHIREEVLHVQMKPVTYRIATAIIEHGIFTGKDDVILADTGVKQQSKLHQIYSGTVILEEGGAVVVDDTKAQFLKKHFKGKKIAIFTKYKAEELLLKNVLGNTTNTPEEFNENDDLWYVGQIQSSREGVNLSTADCLVYFNIDFSALSYLQGRDRATHKHRKKENVVYWIFSNDGIESRIYKTVRKKEDYTLKHYKRDRKLLSNKVG